MAAQNNLSVSLQQLDANGVTLARRIENFSYLSPIVGEWRVGNLPDTSSHAISLVGLVPQPLQVMLKHTGQTGTITVVWTPNGGSSATVIVLGPGDMIAFWQTTTNAAYGISALALTASVSTTPFELFIGG